MLLQIKAARAGWIAGLVLVGSLLLPAARAADPLTVGIFPRRDAALSRTMFRPLADYLSEKLSRQVKLDAPPDFPSFFSRLSRKNYDLVHFNQYHYIRSHAELGYTAILQNEEFGRSGLASAIWVRTDSNITSPQQLKGGKIIFGGGKQAMVSYIMATDLLRSAGLKEGDYLTQFTLHPLKALVSLYYRQGLAAGIGDIVHRLPEMRKQIDTSQVRILMKSAPLPHLPWAVHPEMTAELAGKIRREMLDLNRTGSGKKILSAMGMTGINRAVDADYDQHRAIVKRVLGEEY